MQSDEIKEGQEMFRKAGNGYQAIKIVRDYSPQFQAVRVRTIDKQKHEWIIKPSEILTVAEKEAQVEIDYVNRFPDILKAWNGGAFSRAEISSRLSMSYGMVRKIVKLALKHKIISVLRAK